MTLGQVVCLLLLSCCTDAATMRARFRDNIRLNWLLWRAIVTATFTSIVVVLDVEDQSRVIRLLK